MPAGNRMGPFNRGPQTGRGMGFCAGYDQPGYAHAGTREFGYCRGAFGGRGHRNWFHATGLTGWERMRGFNSTYPSAPQGSPMKDEQEILKDQEKWLEDQLEQVRSQLKDQPEE